MGIFDEAIREHLDLKRRQGVAEDELKELEDEAFGLPARPGDEPAVATDEAPPQEPSDSAPAEADAPAQEAPVAEEPQAPVAEPPAPVADEPAPAEEEPEAVPEPEDEAPPHGDALLEEEGAEPPQPPPEEPVRDEGAGFTTTEREAIAEKPTEFFDQAPEPLELGELDLDLSEELDDVGAIEGPGDGEGEVEESPLEPDPEPEPAPQEPSAEAEPEGEPAEGEDVLEETPEFLRENPDDDELWFEQGKPKDFDF